MTAGMILAIAITVAGGVVSGLAGFGFALVCVPPLLLVYEPPAVVTASILLSIVTGVVVLAGALGSVRWRMVAGLLPAATAGIFVGARLLTSVPAAAVSLIASTAVMVFTLAMMRGWTMPGADTPAATAAAGGASGVLNALTGMAGPPVAMLFDA
ncbi:MAG: sulfite exporter TauE/SafE family protein, partial [Chloroflexota bacterium]